MLQFQNTYTPPAASSQTMNGRPLFQTDWSTEITPAPVMQGQARPASDTGMGGMANSGMMGAPGRMAGAQGNMTGGMMMQGDQTFENREDLNMRRTGLPAEVIESPTTAAEAYKGSLKAMLNRYIGAYVVATFLVGTQGTVSWEGVLFDVGNDFVTIYQEARDRYIVTDIYSLRYIEFYDTRRREMCEVLLRNQGWQGEG